MVDHYTYDEAKRIVRMASLGMSAVLIWKQLGKHTPGSIFLFMAALVGYGSVESVPLYDSFAAQLNRDASFNGWRSEIDMSLLSKGLSSIYGKKKS